MEAQIGGAPDGDGVVERGDACVQEEENKELVVIAPHAVINPRTVVIHPLDAAPAESAVVRSIRLRSLALSAKGPVLLPRLDDRNAACGAVKNEIVSGEPYIVSPPDTTHHAPRKLYLAAVGDRRTNPGLEKVTLAYERLSKTSKTWKTTPSDIASASCS